MEIIIIMACAQHAANRNKANAMSLIKGSAFAAFSGRALAAMVR